MADSLTDSLIPSVGRPPLNPSVAVLMGGPSSEHVISLKSGHGVVEALTRRGWLVQAIEIPYESTVEQASQCARRALTEREVDVAFIALHGPFGEDGTIQRLCESLGVVYTGSSAQASQAGLDKVASRRRFERIGLRVPQWQVVDAADRERCEQLRKTLQLPVVVKPTNQGSSLGVSIVRERGGFASAIELAARYDTRVLIETFINGRELTVGILGDVALPIVEIKPIGPFFDYTAKYTPGMTEYLVPAPLEAALAARVQEAGRRAHQALGCRHFSRVDLMLDENHQPVVLEVNTIPGLTSTSLLPKAAACLGISYDELCERLVLMALASSGASEHASVKSPVGQVAG